jgi:class 3 adenylate cyclase/tetratricopeptide (TPR) repeat protein
MALPEDAARALDAGSPAALHVQLSAELDWLPVESFEDGSGRWQRRFQIVRQFALARREQDRPPPEPEAELPRRLRVLVLTDASFVQPRTVAEQKGEGSQPGLPPELAAEWAPADPALAAVADLSWHFAADHFDSNDLRRADVIVLACHDAARHAVERAGRTAPALWAWSATGADVEAVLALRAAGHAALLAPPALEAAALLAVLAPWLQACAKGATPAEAVLTLAQSWPIAATRAGVAANNALDPAPWRLYHAEHRPLCRVGMAAGTVTQGSGGHEVLANEHRQVTALSFDLVDSTLLMGRLGHEGYSETLGRMHAACIECVQTRGGVVADRQDDDGSMACFGVPQALEDGAVRALDAALAMQDAVAALPGRPQLRIGLATGRVAVRGGVPFGTPLHLAARLRQRARPGESVVDDTTRRLARHRFDFAPMLLGEPLKGIAENVRASRLLAVRSAAVFDPPALTPFVGREAELAELRYRWARAAGGGMVALVVHGDVGVGKTRLVREFLGTLRADGGRFFELRGLPETQGSAFRTLADAMRHSLGLNHEDSDSGVQAALVRALPRVTLESATLQRLSRLLGIGSGAAGDQRARARDPAPASDGRPPLQGAAAPVPRRERERLIEALAGVVAAAAVDEPLALVVEDLQWVDPSTREVLQHVLETSRPVHLLVLCTQRDADASAPTRLAAAEMLALGRLSPAASRWLIREASADSLPPDLVQRLAERADGVPLFLEESARMAVEAGPRAGALMAEVPATLEGLLMARVDRLGARGKPLCQVAAVLGRDFPAELLDRVAADPELPLSVSDAGGQLAALGQAGVLRAHTAAGVPRLAFRHELIRDVAYLSLWQRDRAAVHAAVARALKACFAGAVEAQPEWLAHHLAGAGEHAEAVGLWERAARAAAAASANREAIRHARAALECLAQAEASATRDATELRLLLLLASRLIAAEGYGAEEVGRVYLRAGALAAAHGDTAVRGKLLLGLESVHVMRGELDRAEVLAQQALESAQAGADPYMSLQARWALANARFHAGDSHAALPEFEACLAAYRPEMHYPAAVQDPGVMCMCYSAWALWEQGRADAAQHRAEEVVALARSLQHRFSLGEAYGFAASIALFRGEVAEGLAWADQAVELCEEAGFTVWLAHARVVRGRLRVLAGDHAGGGGEMEAGYRLWTATGAAITRPFYLSLIAATHLEAGRAAEAAPRVDEARALVERTGERYHLAELLRLAGLVALAEGDAPKGQVLLRQAMALAAAQGKQAFVLRAATALGEHLAASGHLDEAKQIVGEALSNIVEGRATADPRRAQALLASMGAERPGCSEGFEAPMAQTRRDSVPPTGVVDETH